MQAAENWKTLLENWPSEFPRQGVIITNLNEAMPFRTFWVKGETLLLERTVPDALGGRFLLLGFEIINSIKIITPLTAEMVASAGFAEPKAAELQAAY